MTSICTSTRWAGPARIVKPLYNRLFTIWSFTAYIRSEVSLIHRDTCKIVSHYTFPSPLSVNTRTCREPKTLTHVSGRQHAIIPTVLSSLDEWNHRPPVSNVSSNSLIYCPAPSTFAILSLPRLRSDSQMSSSTRSYSTPQNSTFHEACR